MTTAADTPTQPSPPETATALQLLQAAHDDLAASRVGRAHDTAQRAAALLRAAGAQPEEIAALALQAASAARLGRHVEAVEAGLLATQLAEALPAAAVTASAHRSLGLAWGWGGNFAQALPALDTARQLARRFAAPQVEAEVALDAAWLLLFRWAHERQGDEPLPPTEALARLPQLAADLADPAAPLACRLWACFSGTAETATAAPTEARRLAATAGWLLAAEAWLQTELARRSGDFEAMLLHASRMAATAAEVQHEPLAALGIRLGADAFEALGRSDLALAEHRRLWQRERRLRAQALNSRGPLLALHQQARLSERQFEALAQQSRQFERWAHEDTLTGIANLRRFQQCLGAWFAAARDAGQHLCVALIDVDHFKQVNDNFSHEIGNTVLRTIAALMTAHVRAQDLPARWGGDEFAILFRDADEAVALQVCERLQQAVAAHDWSAVAPKLAVGISIGVVQAQADDNDKSLLNRSDQAMYARKKARRAAPAAAPLPRLLLERVVRLARVAQRVVIVVGDTAEPAVRHDLEGSRFLRAEGLQQDPVAFQQFWADWRREQARREPLPVHRALVELGQLFPEVCFISERIDGALARAGAEPVLEIYGNAVRTRCSACGGLRPVIERGRCLFCGSPEVQLRPDITLVGEQPDLRCLAGAELAAKRADLVLVLDGDGSISTSASLLDKARVRQAKVVMLGSSRRARNAVADVMLPGPAETVIRQLIAQLRQPVPVGAAGHDLSDAGFAALCYLTGQSTDHRGRTLKETLGWANWEIERQFDVTQWQFPLPTPSAVCPDAPTPSPDDFALLATEEAVRDGVRQAFVRMLAFYGFAWRDGDVVRAVGWREGFAGWATAAGPNDLRISRMLGALALLGLVAEAQAFFAAVEAGVRAYRGGQADRPIRFWRDAARIRPPATA